MTTYTPADDRYDEMPYPRAGRSGLRLPLIALAWVLRRLGVTTALVGASRPEQVEENVAALDRLALSEDEEAVIEDLLKTPATA